jgi:iron complex transport system substrate-binding protein
MFSKNEKLARIPRLLYIALVIAVLALGACSAATQEPVVATPVPQEASTDEIEPTATAEPPTPEPLVFKDGMGREVVLDGPAQRIVSIAPSNTEMLFAIGAGDKIVGRDDFSDYPSEAMEIPSIGSTYGDLNAEAIVNLDPDLVLAAGITPPEHIEAMESVGLTVYVLANPNDFKGLFENMLTAGELTGNDSEAAALVEDLQKRFNEIVVRLEGVESVSLFYEIDATDPTSPWTIGNGTFQSLAIELAGGSNIFDDLDGWVQVSLEEIVVRDPSVIVFADGPFVQTSVDSLKERSGWGGLSAVQEGRVYAINTDLLDLPGPRLVEGLETMAKILHPELFVE